MRPGLGSFTLVATMAVGAAVPSGAVAGQAAPEAGEPDPARERAIAEVKKARAAAWLRVKLSYISLPGVKSKQTWGWASRNRLARSKSADKK